MARKYKSWELYMCLALNRLVMELDLDIYQEGLEEKLDDILAKSESRLPKSEISYEIKSNHQMTNKILKNLRKYNEFYISMYEEIIKDHYKFRQIPAWFRTKE
jgi:hypothetical protein